MLLLGIAAGAFLIGGGLLVTSSAFSRSRRY